MPRYHVFLSHCGEDKTAVEDLARRLRTEGIEPWLDKWHLIPGMPWQPAIEDALTDSATCAVFIGPSGLGPWQHEEMRAAIDRRVSESRNRERKSFRVIPVLLPGAERGERGRLPWFLAATTWVEFRSTLDDPNAFYRLLCGIRGTEPGPAPGEAVAEGQCPYRGLETFQETHARFFFGREALTEWLLNALRPARGSLKENRFLSIIGASGGGKSSLARAGLVPALRRGELPGSDQWPIVVLRPGADPLESLAVALASAGVCGSTPAAIRQFIRELSENENHLHLAVRLMLQGAPERRLVVLLDQFEEIFTLAPPEPPPARLPREALIRNLLYAANVVGGQTIVILTLRADFFGQCASYPNLAETVSDHDFLVGPLTEEELRRAVEKPARLSGCEFEAGLVDVLMADFLKQSGSLPLLQHALLELWHRREGRRLTHAAYAAIGKVEGALDNRANEVYRLLSDSEREVCRKIFLRLVQLGEDAPDTKRRVPQKALESLGDPARVQGLIRTLSSEDNRLLLTDRSPENDEATVEIAHEALIRSWTQLRSWLDKNREFLLWHQRLRSYFSEWRRTVLDPSSLLRGAALIEARIWLDIQPEELEAKERDFIHQSEKQRCEEERAIRLRRQRIRLGVSVASMLIVILAALAVQQGLLALKNRQIGLSRRLVAQAELLQSKQENKLQHAALLTVESMRRSPSAEGDQALRHALKLLPRPITLMPHQAAVVAVAYSPNGQYLVTASADAAQLWDATSGARLGQPAKHAGPVNAVVFSPDGQCFATASQDKTTRLWETATGREVGSAMQHARGVAQVVFSPNGRRLATLSYDNVIRIWSTNSGGLVEASLTNKAIVKAIAFGSEANTLAVAYNDGFARLWDVATRQEIASMKHGGVVRSVAFNQTGDLLATACEDGAARVWPATSRGVLLDPLIKVLHQDAVVAAVFSNNGQRLATASYDYSARVWDAHTGQELTRMIHDKEAAAVAFSPDGNHLATASDDGTARTWEITGYSEFRRKGAGAEIKAVAFGPDGRYFAAAGLGQIVRMYETATGKDMTNFVFVHDGPVAAIAFSSDGRYLATACGGRSGAALVWDLNGGQRVNYFAQTAGVATVAFTKNGRYLALGCDNGLVSVLTIPGGNIVWRTNHPVSVRSVAFSPDQKRLATACADNFARLWDLAACKEVMALKHGGSVNAVCFSPNGDYLATASTDRSARIWDAVSGNPVGQFNHESGALAVAFSPDGKHLAIGVGDGVARVLEWRKDQEIAHMTHDNFKAVESVAFSPNGDYLATASGDGTARLWHWQPQQLIDEACVRLTRNFSTNEWKDYFGAGAAAERYRQTCPNLP